MIALLVVALVRAFALAALALLAMPLLSRAPAAARRTCLTIALGLSLVAPLVSSLAPAGLVPSSVVERARAPFAEPSEHGPVVAQANGVAAHASEARDARGPSIHSVLVVLVVTWAAVALVLVVRLVAARARASRLGLRGAALEPGIVVTSDVDGPVVVGTFAHRILLPPASLEWSDERREVVLAHERAHVSSRDGLVRLVADLACAVYWPSPSTWIVARRLSRECELAADERAVRSGIAPTTVAEHLVAVARESLAPAPATTFAMASELERRVMILLEGRASTWSRRRSIAALATLGAGLSLVACAGAGSASGNAAKATTTTVAAAPTASEDAEVAAIAEEERSRAVTELGAKGAVVLVMDATNHALLAAKGDVDTARVPGSTVKPLVVAAALDAGLLDTKTAIDCGGGARMYGTRKLSDASPNGALDLAGMLAVSSNVGASRVADLLGKARTVGVFESVGLGAGLPPRIDDDFELAVVAAGEGLRATPRALVTAYGALVDGKIEGREVFRPETAARVRVLLEDVVYAKEGTGGRAAIPSARISGKTGTSENGKEIYASFVGFLPSRAPRYVIYVGVDSPRDNAPGGRAAAPVFARIASRLSAR